MVNNVANFVEVDGESHDFEERIGRDEVCDRWFPSRGYGVLRLANDEVIRNLGGAALAILEAAEQAAPPSLTLPRKGGGNGKSPPLGKQGDV